MSTYVMSDIHGEYKKYIAMLKKIKLKDNDTLYILGDVVDRGKEPVKILQDMALRPNVVPIIGNHELMALDILETLATEITDENYDKQISGDFFGDLIQWKQNGGETTLNAFTALSKEDRKSLIEYVKEFSVCEVIDIKENTFILCHSGCISSNKKLKDHSLEELTVMRADYDKNVFNDEHIYIVSGHTPTLAITYKSEIFKQNNNINIDCGATFSGGKLACLRLDDFAEFYV